MSTRALLSLGVLLIGAFAITYSWEPSSSASIKPPKERKAAPDFALPDASGATVRLSAYKGKVVLLNFWATWCGPCKVEIPWFVEFEKMYQDRGLAVVGVSMDEDGWQAVKPYVAKNNIRYRILLGDEPVAKLYDGLESLPVTVLIDRKGNIAAQHLGLIGRRAYEDEIRDLLVEKDTR